MFSPPETVKDLLQQGKELIGQTIRFSGRISRMDDRKKVVFGEIHDGTTTETIKFIYFGAKEDASDAIRAFRDTPVGSSVTVTGEVKPAPSGKQQAFEVHLTDAKVYSGITDPETYQYGLKAHKKLTPEEMHQHLTTIRGQTYDRFKDKTFQTLMRIRGQVKVSLMRFFSEKDFVQIDGPCFTSSDCEGAGEMFTVTTLPLEDIPKTESGKPDYSKDFFGSEMHLTVSAQLEAEAAAQQLQRVFTFGRTFRAEHSKTSRHLAEFEMLEPEMVFTQDDPRVRFSCLMDLEEAMVKHIIMCSLTHMMDELSYLDEKLSPGLVKMLEQTLVEPFGRISYTDAIDVLIAAVKKGVDFEDKQIYWGMDLASEHERYICEKIYGKPVFVTDYPQDLKSFYMKANTGCPPDRVTCQAVDLLIPGVGELCGGSMREDDPEKLVAVMEKKGVPVDTMGWYIGLRRDGVLPTGGFGLGFARLLVFLTGAGHVQNVVPFPMSYKK